MTDATQIISYWKELGPKGWFVRDDRTDREISDRFATLHSRAASGELDGWTTTAEGALALVILLDQFSRNMFRDDARAFATDEKAIAVAEQAIEKGFDRQTGEELRVFFYMPFMHSEKISDQRRCVALMHRHQNPDNLKYAIIHLDVIARFGRFPHRNAVLGRHTTPAEQKFLDSGGFSG